MTDHENDYEGSNGGLLPIEQLRAKCAEIMGLVDGESEKWLASEYYYEHFPPGGYSPQYRKKSERSSFELYTNLPCWQPDVDLNQMRMVEERLKELRLHLKYANKLYNNSPFTDDIRLIMWRLIHLPADIRAECAVRVWEDKR